MGWFWADSPQPAATSAAPAATSDAPLRSCPVRHGPPSGDSAPPSGCPVHKPTIDALNPHSRAPKPPATVAPTAEEPKQKSLLSQLNPLNYMFPDLSQSPAPNQAVALPTTREESSIPRGDNEENWEYPSPQQMYNALLRKGYADTDITAVEDMVSVHNFLNEGAWGEILGWEERFSGGFYRGWKICSRGEENTLDMVRRVRSEEGKVPTPPTLIRFQGRPKEMTPKAAMIQLLSWAYPSKFGVEPPFDRHDWYVSRNVNGKSKEVRYVIDFYSAPPEPTGEPVFFLDVRPAMTPSGAAERLIRWGSDVWWRASGGVARERQQQAKQMQ